MLLGMSGRRDITQMGGKALSWDFWRLYVWLYFIVGLFKPEVLL